MTLRFKWFSRMVPPGFKLIYSFMGWPRPGWSLWRDGKFLHYNLSVADLRKHAWALHYASLPLPEVQE